MIVGIDFGSKLAGTTAIAYLGQNNQIKTLLSEKKQDADKFVSNFILEQKGPLDVYLDAPLSLPGVYRDIKGCSNYFYRKCDLEVKAMSPMFLGGLTARAIKLCDELSSEDITFFETYPKLIAHELELVPLGYKNNSESTKQVLESISQQKELKIVSPINTWHEIDAILALLIGLKHANGSGRAVGDSVEGLIYG